MWPLKIRVLLSRFLERRCKCAHENLKKTGSIEYISKRGYSHSISRLSVEPAAFGTWMKITASEAQSAWVMAGLLLGGGLCGVAPTHTPRAVMIFIARAVFTFRYQFLLVRVVTESPSFLPSPGYGSGRLHAQTVTVPQFPIFTLCMNHVEHGHLDRAHSLTVMGQTGETLKAVMGAITVLLYKIIGHHAGVFPAACELTILNAKPCWVFA